MGFKESLSVKGIEGIIDGIMFRSDYVPGNVTVEFIHYR